MGTEAVYWGYGQPAISGCSRRVEEPQPEEYKLPLTCSGVVKQEDKSKLENHRQEIARQKSELEEKEYDQFDPWIWGWRPGGLVRQDNPARVFLAGEWLKVYLLDHDPHSLQKVFELTEAGLNTFDTMAEPWKIPMYFELALQKADALLMKDPDKAFSYCEKILAQLGNKDFLKDQGEAEAITVPGYRRRAYFIKASALLSLGRTAEAEALFLRVAASAQSYAASTSDLTATMQNQEKKKIEYLGYSAHLKLGFLCLYRQDFKGAKDHFNLVLSWERIGSGEDPYLDLAFAALIGALQIAAVQEDPAAWYNTNLPWEKINPYAELKKVLLIEDDLSNQNVDKFQLFISAFIRPASKAVIGDQLKALLQNAKVGGFPSPSLGAVEFTEGRAKLDSEKVNAFLSLPQLEKIIRAIAAVSLDEGLTFALDSIREEVFENPALLPYFLDEREYWNNTIILLSVLIRKQIEIPEALELIKLIRARIETQKAFDQCYGKSYSPDAYHLALLDLTEAELLSQTRDPQKLLSAILLVNRARSFPHLDNFSLTKGKIILGDLHRQLGYLTGEESYFKTALSFYKSAASSDIDLLKGMAQLKRADLFISSPGPKAEDEILDYLDLAEEGIKKEKVGSDPFFFELYKLTKGKLYLALAEKQKFETDWLVYASEAQTYLQSVSQEYAFLHEQAGIKLMGIEIQEMPYALNRGEISALEIENRLTYYLESQAHLGDYEEFWNNIIVVLGLQGQAVIAEGNQNEIERVLLLTQSVEDQIPLTAFPGRYYLSLLDLTIAELCLQLHRPEGLERALQALTALEEEEDSFALAKAMLLVGDLYQQRNDPAKAAAYYADLIALEAEEALQGLALIKKAVVFSAWEREKTHAEISCELKDLEKGITLLKGENEDDYSYFLHLAKVIRGELILSLAGTLPMEEALPLIRSTIVVFEDPELVEFKAWAKLKRAEVAIRLSEHVAPAPGCKICGAQDILNLLKEAEGGFKPDEYLGVELIYLKAVALLFLNRREDYKSIKKLCKQVKDNAARLPDAPKHYFQLLADLKIAEVSARESLHKYKTKKLFKELEPRLIQLEKYAPRLGIDIHSLYAEFYFEVFMLNQKQKEIGKKALEFCVKSRSPYDRVERQKILLEALK